jgi:hypothetical protein
MSNTYVEILVLIWLRQPSIFHFYKYYLYMFRYVSIIMLKTIRIHKKS